MEPFEKWLLFGSLLLGLGWLLAGCDKFYIASAASITTADKAVQVAADQLPTAEAAKLAQITATAATRDDAVNGAALLRKKGDVAETSIISSHKSLKFAADALMDVRRGLASKGEVSKWIAAAVRAYRDLRELLHDFDIDLPGVI